MKSYENFANHKKARNHTTQIRKAKGEYEAKLADRVKENPKQFYEYVNSKRKTKHSIGPLTDENGLMSSDSREMGNMLNTFLGSVFTSEEQDELEKVKKKYKIVSSEKNSNLNELNITEEKIERAIDSL